MNPEIKPCVLSLFRDKFKNTYLKSSRRSERSINVPRFLEAFGVADENLEVKDSFALEAQGDDRGVLAAERRRGRDRGGVDTERDTSNFISHFFSSRVLTAVTFRRRILA